MNFPIRTTAWLSCLGFCLAAASAKATIVDFDTNVSTTNAVFSPFLTSGDYLSQNGFYIDTVSTKAGAQPGDLVGALVDGRDNAACFNVSCPSNNATTYLALVDDGLPFISTVSGAAFRIASLDASFIGAAGAVIPSVPAILRVYGFVGSTAYYEDLNLNGLSDGTLSFSTYAFSTVFASRAYDEVDFYGYACDSTGASCVRSANTAQFALDNIDVTAVTPVPEPATVALLVLGLAGLGLTRRSARA